VFPRCVKKVILHLVNNLGLKRLGFMLNTSLRAQTAYDYMMLSGEQTALCKQMAAYWDNLNLDAMVSPLFPTAAFQHGDSKHIFPAL
jgi:hypothetical protein